MHIVSDALNAQSYFDPRYTGEHDNSSPGLRWDEVPAETRSFALLVEDPDAPEGLFTHWVIYSIPPQIRHLPAGIPPQESLPNGIRQGLNSYGKLGYSGPNPPQGSAPHRYFFKLYALREHLELPNRATREELLAAISPHIIATCEIVGRYGRAIQKAG